MAEALEQKSSLGVKLESTYGVNPTLASANMMEYLKGSDIPPAYKPDVLERNVVRNTFSKLAGIRGAEFEAGGNVSLELRGSGTAATAPDSDALWECAMGVKNTSTASTTHATTVSTLTAITLVASGGSSFAVGDAVLIDPLGGTAYEVVWVTAISTDQLTVSPAMSSIPGAGVDVGAGVHYKLSTAELKSFWGSLWLGDQERYDFPGSKVDKLSMSFSSGELVTPQFDFQSKNTVAPVAEAYGLGTPSYDSTNPLVAVNMTVTMAGTSYSVSDIALEVNNNMFKRKDVTSSGISKVIRTGRTVGGSFSLLYEDSVVDDSMRADTELELVVVAGSTAGNIFAVRLPKIRYTEIPVSVNEGIYQYDVTFEANLTSAEDELTSISYL